MAMVQTIDSAKYSSMPRSGIETDLVDYILPPEKMPAQLIAYAQHAYKKVPPKLIPAEGKIPDALQKIFILLRTNTGHDFSAYKRNTIYRRIERRMNVNQIDKISIYVRYLQDNKIEVDNLFKELLIGVTNFFRDIEAFEAIKQKAIPTILKDRPKDYVLRVWVPGCSSGEEAYSIAITLRECTEKLKQHYGIQIFATDIDDNAIEAARAGIYPGSISADVSSERLKRFFIVEGNFYRVKKYIREMLVFASQDIIKDPPFTKLDLVCCRNLLIYLESDLQKKLVPLFHYSLKPGGILFLGSSETIGEFTDHFSPIDRKWKIFKRNETISPGPVAMEFPAAMPLVKAVEADKLKPVRASLAQLAEKALLESYAPPSVIINDRGEILYIHGRTGKYLEPAPGEAKWNLYEMAREGLKLELPTAIRKAMSQKTEVKYEGLHVNYNGGTQLIDLTVKPIGKPEAKSGVLLVVFEDVSPSAKKKVSRKKRVSKNMVQERIEALERELQYSKENLQITIEELETSNEELKSTNEELQSTNEELQSTNEELETSKEEQQSLNEELTTVNTELQGKIDQLTMSNDDMKNLLDSIDIPTIFLDNDLRVKRFTSHATRVINLIQTDIGRPISDIVTKINNETLVADAKAVIEDLVFREKTVRTKDGTYYEMRIAPYRTAENVIDGVVITFLDLTKGQAQEARTRRFANVLEDSHDAITVQNFEGNILAWNKGAVKMYGYSEAEALDMNIRDIIPREKIKEALKFTKEIAEGKKIVSFKTQRKAKDGSILDVWLTVTKLVDASGIPVELATTERNLAWLADA
jgi:two-component system CheB/CheR fusion protein